MGVAEVVFELAQLRRRRQRLGGTAAVNDDLQRHAGADADDALHVGEAVDRLAVDRRHEVAGLEAGRLRRAARLHGVDPRARDLAADGAENDGEDDDREYEIGDRTGRDDRGTRADRLEDETAFLLFLGHLRGGVPIRDTGGVLVTEELDEAAERNGGKLPARAVAV